MESDRIYISTSKPHTTDCLDEPSTYVEFGIVTVQIVNDAYRKRFYRQL